LNKDLQSDSLRKQIHPSSMDKYRRVDKPKSQEEAINENEIRVTTQGKMRNYISYASSLFQEKQEKTVVLKAMGRAINKTVTIAEILKRRVPKLHQITHIESTDITDVYEPLEEGLERVESTRHVSSVTITLSLNQLDTKSCGYQPPIPEDQVKPFTTTDRTRGPSVDEVEEEDEVEAEDEVEEEAEEGEEEVIDHLETLRKEVPHNSSTYQKLLLFREEGDVV